MCFSHIMLGYLRLQQDFIASVVILPFFSVLFSSILAEAMAALVTGRSVQTGFVIQVPNGFSV